ncbi:hypothetical protein K438DRAFT_774201 [Mycena galopus ATCC 62051]|nr:hypothetical protein K438DRAFT_774201 [Mycena galopus ATCC 62051]
MIACMKPFVSPSGLLTVAPWRTSQHGASLPPCATVSKAGHQTTHASPLGTGGATWISRTWTIPTAKAKAMARTPTTARMWTTARPAYATSTSGPIRPSPSTSSHGRSTCTTTRPRSLFGTSTSFSWRTPCLA